MKVFASGDDKAAGEAHREAESKHEEAGKAHEADGNQAQADQHKEQAAQHGEAAQAHEHRAAAPGYSEHTAAKADLTEKIKAAMDAGRRRRRRCWMSTGKSDRPAVAPEPQLVEALPPGQSGGGEFAGTSISTPESAQGSQGRHMTGDEIGLMPQSTVLPRHAHDVHWHFRI